MGYDDELAAYDTAAARTFGRRASEAAAPTTWRTGPPGVMTEAEYDDAAALTFGRFSDAQQEAEVRRRVAESQRQREHELELIESAGRIGWSAVVCRRDVDRQVAESVRARAEGGTTTGTSEPAQQVRESRTTPGSGRTEVREVTGWQPKRWGAR